MEATELCGAQLGAPALEKLELDSRVDDVLCLQRPWYELSSAEVPKPKASPCPATCQSWNPISGGFGSLQSFQNAPQKHRHSGERLNKPVTHSQTCEHIHVFIYSTDIY